MSNQDRRSRLDKYNKRRKNTKAISFFLIIAGFLVIILLFILIFGGNNSNDKPEETSEITIEENKNEDDTTNIDEEMDTDDSLSEEENKDNETESKVQKEEIKPTDDNVSQAFTGNWEPIGTEQSEPHTTEFNKDSQDWKEMEEAVRVATGLDEMITFYIGNGGDDKAIATVTSTDESEIYRVTITWVPEEGWQPTLLEKLKENDKK